MMKHILIFIASALLLLQLSHAFPRTKRSSVTLLALFQNSSSEEVDSKTQLVVTTLDDITEISRWVLEKGSVVVNNAVKELELLPDKDELLRANITRMSKIATEASQVKLVEDEQSILKLLDYMVTFSEMMADYENMPYYSKQKEALKTALENNGYNKFEKGYEEKVLQLTKDFDEKFSKYVSGLTPADRITEAKLLKWYDDYKAETDEEKKFEKFGEFFDNVS
ncbi:uncharacterized protein LOC105218094 [Zeugodacus cucurbitae]|uniref:Dihydrolipoyllysine-residue acetyltransferase component of pyruvate dehydrogenase complex n=1 Tax=Zeugodacus cucurbitae TaxID=28588 RepID=A0A0A1WWI6_ZEUCU|nr:uncharacterized protein LOC105218094 [Zeugodacus cucurbitae]